MQLVTREKAGMSRFLFGCTDAETYKTKSIFKFGVIITIALFIILGISCQEVNARTADTPRFAVITSLTGSVMVRAVDQNVALPARMSMQVKAGDLIITGSDSNVELTFDDGSVSRIASNSRVEIGSLYREGDDGPDVAEIIGVFGTIWNNIKSLASRNSRFEINTPLAIAGVRGTLFLVRIEGNEITLIRVYDGQIRARSSNPGTNFSVKSFQQINFIAGSPATQGTEPIDFLSISNYELLNLMKDNMDVFIALLELAAENGELDFLEQVKRLLDSDQAREILGNEFDTLSSLLDELRLKAASVIPPEPEPDAYFEYGGHLAQITVTASAPEHSIIAATFSYTGDISNSGETFIPAIPLVIDFDDTYLNYPGGATIDGIISEPDFLHEKYLEWYDISSGAGLEAGNNISYSVPFVCIDAGDFATITSTVDTVDENGTAVYDEAFAEVFIMP